ncbi:hypothetical protein DPM19_06630 [Actinomadura craniellae]|uniref:Cell division protein FtsL n=1 Tax=Actinomadura craniellae TaxID=2231787 RepID=A0A365HE58_9ACTN|nr:hypothetical protein [Actinomadura craniellae]RAY16533.1 hypothetical protein DPM19_06630 [Actinomadura craniellae]
MTTTTTRRPRRSAPARTGGRKAAPEPAAQPAPKRARAGRGAAPPRTPFVLLVVGLLGGALVSLLLLNTVLAEDAFTITELQRGNKQLGQSAQELEQQIAREESPEQLERKAKALGGEQSKRPAFIDAPTGQVVGGAARPAPDAGAAAAGAAGVLGVPGAAVPGMGAPVAGAR